MEFRLLYTGDLPVHADAPTKQHIRSYFHPQLKKLWSLHPGLLEYAAAEGSLLAVGRPTSNRNEMAVLGWGGIAANWDEFGFNFLPLVQKEVFLACSLDVLFLRKGGQGNIVINGDIDARLKTLFDALQKPQQRSECGGASPTEEEKPFFVLLENDNLISEIKVTTDQLLDYSGRFLSNAAVHLVINVKLWPMRQNRMSWVFQ